MSPKHSALAYDDMRDQAEEGQQVGFEPEISLIINKLSVKSSSSPITAIGGKVTVSF